MEKISVLIITRNEAKYIERCLESVSWADEIVVVDAYSEDETPELAQAKGKPWSDKLKWYQREWDSFRLQRNFSLDKASHSWVFVIDSDEACSEKLAAEIRSTINAPEFDAYKVRRQEYFLGQRINWGIWNPSYQDRLFKKEGIRYINDVHEYPGFKAEPGRIHAPIEHAPDFNPEKFLYKMNKYTGIEAWDRYQRGTRTNRLRIATAFLVLFWKNFVHHRGYRDGYYGFIISILEGLSRTVRHVKIWQIQQGKAEEHWKHPISQNS
jgi:glycosyltransferase involved in cell wall biosynthesis